MEFQAINSMISKLEAVMMHGIPTVKVQLPRVQTVTTVCHIECQKQLEQPTTYYSKNKLNVERNKISRTFL